MVNKQGHNKEKDKVTKGIDGRKILGEELRYKSNHFRLNVSGLSGTSVCNDGRPIHDCAIYSFPTCKLMYFFLIFPF
jgi:hypothetical protein